MNFYDFNFDPFLNFYDFNFDPFFDSKNDPVK